ncbi:MAG: tetratricopeptide repeat protein, partial [Planctomycetota bacterium]
AELDGPSVTITGDLLGTPAYMSPEQAMAKRVRLDHRTDVYSLGATLYETATLRPPFEGTTLQDLCSQIISKDPSLPRSANRHVPKDLETIVLKAMDKDRDKRYQSAGEFARDLRRFAEGGAIRARRIGIAGRTWRRVKRHKVRSLLAAGLLLAVGGAVWLALQAAAEAEWRKQLMYAELCTDAVEAAVQRGDLQLAPPDLATNSGGPFARPGHDPIALFTAAIELVDAPYEAYLGRALVAGRPLGERLADLDRAAMCGMPARTLHLARAALYAADGRWVDAETERARAAGAAEGGTAPDYFEALLLLTTGERDAAHELLEHVIATATPRSVEYYLAVRLRGSVSFRERDFLAAYRDLIALQALGDESLTIRARAACLLRRLEDRAEEAERQFEELRDEVRRLDTVDAWAELASGCRPVPSWHDRVTAEALDRYPEAVPLLLERVVALHAEGQAHDALLLCQRAERLEPDSPTVLKMLGNAWRQWGRDDRDRALDAYRAAVALNERDWDAQAKIGAVLVQLGRFDDALMSFEAALHFNPGSPALHASRANALRALKRFQEALDECDHALRINPSYANAHVVKGILLAADLDRLEDGCVEFRRAIELNPGHGQAWWDLGHALYKMGRLREALDVMEHLTALFPGRGWWELRRLKLLIALNQPDEALAEADRLVQEYAGKHSVQHACGQFYHELGELEKARNCYTAAVGLSPPGHVLVLLSRGRAHHQMGHLRQALEDYASVLGRTKQPRLRAWARIHRGTILSLQGEPGKAQQAFESALGDLHRLMDGGHGGDAYDWFLAAMASWQLGKKHAAREYHKRAVARMDDPRCDDEVPPRLRAEAAEMLGIDE